jgi:hypothetical protein
LPNALIRFVAGRMGCERMVCTTCGGWLAFMGELKSFAQGRRDLLELLENITEDDVRQLHAQGAEIPSLLNEVTEPNRAHIVTAWLAGPAHVPTFAENLLEVVISWPEASPFDRTTLIQILLPHALDTSYSAHERSRRLRDLLDRVAGETLRQRSDFRLAREGDAAHDRWKAAEAARAAEARAEQRLQQEQAQRERDQRIREVGALPLLDRLELILADRTGVSDPLPASWAELSESDIETLPAQMRMALQRKLAARRRGPWRRLRGRLHAAGSRQAASQRRQFVAEIENVTSSDRLEMLLSTSFPVAWFPDTLAIWTLQHLTEMETPVRQKLIARLATQRRGGWGQLRRALRSSLGQ